MAEPALGVAVTEAVLAFVAIFAFKISFPIIVLTAGLIGLIGSRFAPDKLAQRRSTSLRLAPVRIAPRRSA